MISVKRQSSVLDRDLGCMPIQEGKSASLKLKKVKKSAGLLVASLEDSPVA
jgi:hypothetical protein